jgi:hypothetical protein
MSSVQRAMAGAVAWLAFVVWRVPGLQHAAWAGALLLLAALVLVPLALELADDPKDPSLVAWLAGLTRLLQLPAALLLGGSLLTAPGGTSALLALPWVILCGMVAATGWFRVRRGGWRRSFDRLCGDAAFIFLGVGGAWVFADRAGHRPLNFEEAIVALTAVHFHFAGLLLPLFAGLIVRAFPDSRLATRAAVGTLLGVPAVAVGITTTQWGWGPSFEAAAGCGLALAGLMIGVLHVRLATGPAGSPLKRALLGIAGGSLCIGMTLAALYAVRGVWAPFPWIDLPWMRAVHGSLNALGFGVCGVVGWSLRESRRTAVA